MTSSETSAARSRSASASSFSYPHRTVFTSSAGKTIVVGEHAVVYGARAVAIPLLAQRMKMRMSSVAQNSAGEMVEFFVGDRRVPPHVAQVVSDAFSLLEMTPHPLSIRSQVSLPIGAGFGSSATLCVAIIRALGEMHDLTLSTEKLAELANKLETRFHGSPSGLDASVVAFEKPILFSKAHHAQPLYWKSSKLEAWQMIVIDSGLRASTKAMVQQAAPFFRGAAGGMRIQQMDGLSGAAVKAMESHDVNALSEIFANAQEILKEIGVVTQELASLVDQCIAAGALAAKVTGAGGGGAVLCLLGNDASKTSLFIKNLRARIGQRSFFPVEV